MMVKLRDATPIVMWIVVVAFVATIFFSWGMDVTGRDTKNVVAVINGKEVPLNNFNQMVEREREKMRSQYPSGEIPAEQSRMLPRQVLETEISRMLIQKTIAQMKLGASADEVFEYIKGNPPPEVYSIPQFQTDSVFDTTKFVAFLNTPQSYENEGLQMLEAHTRTFLVPMQRLQWMLGLAAVPSPAEVAYQYRALNDKVKFEYARVATATLPVDPAITSGPELQKYYTANTDSFATDEQVDLYYIKVPKTATARDEQILVEELMQTKARIELDSVKFEDEAKYASDDEGSAAKGGDLGWFGKGSMVPQFDSVAFVLKPGIISSPVKTQYGYHLVLVDSTRVQSKTAQIKARHILRKIVPSIESLDRLEAYVDSVHGSMTAGSFHTTPRENGIIIDSTGFFAKGATLPQVGYVSGLMSWAFNAQVGEVSEKFDMPEAFYVFMVKNKLDKGTLPFTIVKDKIAQKLSMETQKKAAQKILNEAVTKLTAGQSLGSLSTINPAIATGVSDSLSALRPFGNDGSYFGKAVAVAQGLKDGVVSQPVDVGGMIYLVRPVAHEKAPVIDENNPMIAELGMQLQNDNQRRIYGQWFMASKQAAKIKDYLKQYYVD